MNILDFIILIILAFSVIGGLKDGVIKKLIFLFGTIIGLLFATKIAGSLSGFFMNAFGFSYILSLIICYILIFLIISIISTYIYKKIVRTSTVFSIWDKLGGAVLGVIESAIILSLILLFLNYLNFPSKEVRNNSLLYMTFYNFAPNVFNYFKEIIPGTSDFFRELRGKF
jgi:membrane protein required for colicin V production